MSGLKLGDIILDPRRIVYIQSLRAVVCTGLQDAVGIGISDGLRGVVERLDAVLSEYKPESLIILGALNSEAHLKGIARRWGIGQAPCTMRAPAPRVRLQLVADDPDLDARDMAEMLGCEVFQEYVWGNYRFVQADGMINSELHLMTISGEPNYSIRVGRGAFGGMKLAAFLKGNGRLMLPPVSSNPPDHSSLSVFGEGLERFDVFAVGHQRVLPLGKVADLKPFKGIVRGLPFAKSTFGAGRKLV